MALWISILEQLIGEYHVWEGEHQIVLERAEVGHVNLLAYLG